MGNGVSKAGLCDMPAETRTQGMVEILFSILFSGLDDPVTISLLGEEQVAHQEDHLGPLTQMQFPLAIFLCLALLP